MPGLKGVRAWRIVYTLLIFIFVTAAVSITSIHFSHRYVASADLVGTGAMPAIAPAPAVPVDSPDQFIDDFSSDNAANSAPASEDLASTASQMVTDDAIFKIARRYSLYSAVEAWLSGGLTSQFRSDFYTENTPATGPNPASVRVSFTASDLQTATHVAQAIVDALCQPRTVKSQTIQTARSAIPAPNRTSAPQTTAQSAPQTPDQTNRWQAILRQQLNQALRQGAELPHEIQAQTEALSSIQARRRAIPRQEAPHPVADPKLASLNANLNAAVKELAALRERYTEEHPDVINARERVEELQAEITQLQHNAATQPRPAPQPDQSPRIAELEAREAQIKANLKTLNRQLSDSQTRIAKLQASLAAASRSTMKQPSPAPPSQLLPAPPSQQLETSEPRFSVLTPVAVRSDFQTLTPGSIAALSLGSGLTLALAFVLLVRRRY
jgi:chaperonin cofactor prefoldin